MTFCSTQYLADFPAFGMKGNHFQLPPRIPSGGIGFCPHLAPTNDVKNYPISGYVG